MQHACKSKGIKPVGVVKAICGNLTLRGRWHRRPLQLLVARSELEHACCDPKDSELCLHRVKPEEILVEARSDTDVQIVRRM